MDRRKMLKLTLQGAALGGIATVSTMAIRKSITDDTVWQIDPHKCIQCGRCATACVVSPSAIKCVHTYKMCGYCDLCGGYFISQVKELNTGAENQLCPTKALKRSFIENPYYKYDVDEDLCIGCGKCVKGCGAFGNGSLYLQVRHNICKNCNRCEVAKACPADAFVQIPASDPYLLKKGWKK